MSLFSGIFEVRSSFAALCLTALLPLGAALSGCSEAPKIPGSQQSESKKEVPTAGAPVPKEDDETASGVEGEPSANEPAPGGGGASSPEVGASEADADAKAKSEEAARKTIEEMRRQLEERSLSSSSAKKSAEKTEAARPSDAAPSPMPPPPPSLGTSSPSQPIPSGSAPPAPPAPAPEVQPEAKDGATASRDRGLAAPPPPVGAADKPKAFDVVPVFFGTDRSVEPDPKRLQFGTERGHKLQLGRALVTVPTIHKVPAIERPWVVEIPYFKYKVYEETEDPNKHFTMQEIASLTKEQLLAYVKERLAKSSTFKDHAFVFVHGFNTSFDAAVYRTAQIAYDLKFDGAPFLYSWPSGGKVASYTYDRGSAEQAEPTLTEFLKVVINESGAKSISLIAHSMGNELLLRVMEQMRPSLPKGVVISQVILAAPDVDRDKFTNIAREITNFAKGVTLYAASNDRALSYSARFWGGVPRAGDVPASGPLIIPGVDTIDVTAVSTDSLGLNHSGYAENETLLNDIALLLQTGERPPDKREPSLLKIQSAAGLYWRYPTAAH